MPPFASAAIAVVKVLNEACTIGRSMPVKMPFGKKGFLWVTAAFFLVTLTGQFYFSWQLHKEEQSQHGEQPDPRAYMIETWKDVLENWQSEFLQLCWQVAGLAFLFYAGSPSSKGEEERTEEKLDYILEKVYGEEQGRKIVKSLESKYPKS
jgi:hypothetical protein